ncbi:MAG: hypothetical protein QOJ02_3220 [Acidobacteriota bacterium]|jgi:hypothetical protein|nr:hypothetical protein [Acidobacteriota bacterium]
MGVSLDGCCAALNLTFEFTDAARKLMVELALVDQGL